MASTRRHRAELLKLRFWPGCDSSDSGGQLLDLDWSWIRSLPGHRIGELRIHDTIGNCDNLRVIFFVPPFVTNPPMVWILSVFQKKRDDFTTAQTANFDMRSKIVLERFYNNA